MMKLSPQSVAIGVGCAGIGLIGAAIVMNAGGPGRAISQLEAGLALARRFETASWLSVALAQLFAVMAGVLPASLVGVAAGAVFGVAKGFTISSASVMVGALASFSLSRSLFRPLIQRAISGRAAALDFDAALGREGWKFVLLLRVSPVMPFAAASYALGLSSVSLREYMLGTLAALPALLGYVVLGAVAEHGLAAAAGTTRSLQWAMLIAGFSATALVVVHIGALVGRTSSKPGVATPTQS
jgi:uncharacterized membrane protein YdjX (TVP38/TMEM64 family)